MDPVGVFAPVVGLHHDTVNLTTEALNALSTTK
jgi:hypothetical protein